MAWRYTTQRAGRRLVQAGLRRQRLEGRQERLRHSGHARLGRATPPGTRADIWLRREFTLPEGNWGNIGFKVHHDEDVEIYLNGVLAASAGGFTTDYEALPINAAGRAALKPGKNLIAVHCRQTGGGQYIDVGFSDMREAK